MYSPNPHSAPLSQKRMGGGLDTRNANNCIIHMSTLDYFHVGQLVDPCLD